MYGRRAASYNLGRDVLGRPAEAKRYRYSMEGHGAVAILAAKKAHLFCEVDGLLGKNIDELGVCALPNNPDLPCICTVKLYGVQAAERFKEQQAARAIDGEMAAAVGWLFYSVPTAKYLPKQIPLHGEQTADKAATSLMQS